MSDKQCAGVTIEVTPEMVEAGVRVFEKHVNWGDGLDVPFSEEIVRAILRASLRAATVPTKR